MQRHRPTRARVAASSVVLAALAAHAAAQQTCQPHPHPFSDDDFYVPENVTAAIAGDTPFGRGILALGGFNQPETFARANGAIALDDRWLGLPSVDRAAVVALFDDGAGPALFSGWGAVRRYTAAGHDPAFKLPANIDPRDRYILAMTVHDDGSGPALYVAGNLRQALAVTPEPTDQPLVAPIRNIIRWNGSAWSSVGPGLPRTVGALAVFDDGSGPALYALAHNRGRFLPDFDTGLVRWDGAAWSAPAGRVTSEGRAMIVHDDGAGPALYIPGAERPRWPYARNDFERWDGAEWSLVGPPELDWHAWVDDYRALLSVDLGQGPRLFVGGGFQLRNGAGQTIAEDLAVWDGNAWSGFAPFPTSHSEPNVQTLVAFDFGQGTRAFAGGRFQTADGVLSPGFVEISEESLRRPFFPVDSLPPNAPVNAVLGADLGDGNTLYAGGAFTAIGETSAIGVARRNVGGWGPVAVGLPASPEALLAADPDDHGPLPVTLFAAGYFSLGSWAPVAAYTLGASAWTPLEPRLNSRALALALHDPDGAGPEPHALYVGGAFTGNNAGDSLLRLARWTGSGWAPVAGGVNAPVRALLSIDEDGPGPLNPSLIVGGEFTQAGAAPALRIARLRDGALTPLGPGLNQTVLALAAYPTHAGVPRLIAAGAFTLSGAAPVRRVAAYDPAADAWTTLAGGADNTVRALLVIPDHPPTTLAGQLLAAGDFTTAGDVLAHGVARFDGSAWAPPPLPLSAPSARALAFAPLDGRPAIWVAGSLAKLNGAPTEMLAAIALCPPSAPKPLNPLHLHNVLSAFGSPAAPGDPADRNADGVIDLRDLHHALDPRD